MSTRKTAVVCGTLLALTLSACGGGASQAESLEDMEPISLTLSTMAPEPSSAGRAATEFARAVEDATDGKITFDIYYAGALLSGEDSLQGVADGVADVAIVNTQYTPQELPLSDWLFDMGSLYEKPFPRGLLGGGAATHELFATNELLTAEFEANNQRVLTALTTGSEYNVICTEPVSSPSDMQGNRTRVGGETWAREVEAIGGVPVTLPAGEVYEALQRGVIDCAMFDPTSFINFGLWEVAKHYVPVPGSGLPGYTVTINLDTWQDLPEEAQEAINQGAATYWENHVGNLLGQMSEFGRDAATEHGVEVHDVPELTSMLEDHQAEVLSAMLENAPPEVGDPAAFVDEFTSSVQAWGDRVSETIDVASDAPGHESLEHLGDSADVDLEPFFQDATDRLFTNQ